ncbi:MAG TPA: FeoA family protein [Chthoniobacterales bacterium]
MTQNCAPGIGLLTPVTLLTAPVGKKMRLHALNTKPELCKRLREMGFCESAQVIKLSSGSNLICQVCGVRLALSRDLGACILVEPLDSRAKTAAAPSKNQDA